MPLYHDPISTGGLFVGPNISNGGLFSITAVVVAASATTSSLNFSVPSTQTFSSANATHQWLLQELSGTNYADTGTGTAADIDTYIGGLQAQPAYGVYDGSSFVATKAWETTALTDKAATSNNTVLDSNNSDLCVRVAFRCNAIPASTSSLASKRDGYGAGWVIFITDTGAAQVLIKDANGNSAIESIPGNHCDGALHYVEFYYNTTADELTTKSDITTNSALDVSAINASLTNTAFFLLGDVVDNIALKNAQYVYAGGAEGAAASTMFAESWWTHGSDPTSLLTVNSRASTIGLPVGSSSLSYFSGHSSVPQIPIGWHLSLTGTTGYGLFCNDTTTNHMSYSENLGAGWADNGGGTHTTNTLVAPDGFKSAGTVVKTAATQYGGLWDKVLLVSGTQYTFSAWANVQLGSGPDVEIRNEADSVVLTEAKWLTLTPGVWQKIYMSYTPVITSDHVLRLRASHGETAEDAAVGFWGIQITEGTGSACYVRTTGTPATAVESNYRVSDIVPTSNARITIPCVATARNSGSSYIFDTEAAEDRRALCRNEGTVWMTKYGDVTGSLWANISGSGPLFGEYSNVVARWDVDAGGLAEDTAYVAATHINAIPSFWNADKIWSDTSSSVRFASAATTVVTSSRDLLIGRSLSSGEAFNGFIESIEIVDTPGVKPVPAGLQPGIDFWLVNETVDFNTQDISAPGFPGENGWYKVAYTAGSKIIDASFAYDQDPDFILHSSGNTGAEINTTSSLYLYGRYRSIFQSSPTSGTVNAVFFYKTDNAEIDCEILSKENDIHRINFVVHGASTETYTVDLGFDPSTGYHEYGFDWATGSIGYFVDGFKVAEATGSNVPSISGTFLLNHWSDGGAWSAGPPLTGSDMRVKQVSVLWDPNY